MCRKFAIAAAFLSTAINACEPYYLIANAANHRLQKCPASSPGAACTTVAGTGVAGSATTQLNHPQGIAITSCTVTAAPTTAAPTTTNVTTTSTTAAPTTTATKSAFTLAGQISVSVAGVTALQMEFAMRAAIAAQFSVPPGVVSVTCTESRRLAAASGRHLVGTWSVDYSIQMDATHEEAVAMQAQANTLKTTPNAMNSHIVQGLTDAGVTGSPAVVVTGFTDDPPVPDASAAMPLAGVGTTSAAFGHMLSLTALATAIGAQMM